MPHYQDTIFSKEGKFESFALKDYVDKNTDLLVDGSKAAHMINAPVKDCNKVSGFDSLFCSTTAPARKHDIFSGTKGSLGCKTNMGLTDSLGGLCLSEEQQQLLKTRGGNIKCC